MDFCFPLFRKQAEKVYKDENSVQSSHHEGKNIQRVPQILNFNPRCGN